ncbi:diphosphoinositol polyphosphate phosphohydrolase 3-beta-like isoform X1 [Puntigrus tetrazona]|uniref:diphosphoinositol polyphosphate phosphohydrolase NUDT4B isoform X1 n=1 Tax=Puntigrus tetrazona TaxID=1606681 RepID=UPI001C8A8703|nr:diphosphoinositol polyphosphate phosphohydrolase NUDT4B isoform X1 [Puntigrus tetrazona]XP_043101859.1 diphosphoinositol polyphosphate phosphohydrolase 3-beta-like isoform X1 [Puntigrus tetrazona]
MKFKPNQTRTYDREGFKRRAACLCFKNEREDEVLLVSSSRNPDQWIVPGGGMEPEEEPCGAAVREVFEEAGVKGKLGRLLGVFEQNQDRKHRTYVYVLTVTETLDAWEDSVNIGRKREWFPVDEAIKVLQSHKPVHAEYLRRLRISRPSTTNGNLLLSQTSPSTLTPLFSTPASATRR